jgi:hypothetical protein
MPTRADLLVLLGPLADILPREAVVVIAGLAAMLAAAVCGRALAQRRPVLFAVGWAAGMAAVAVLQAGFDGLMRYGAGVRVADAVPLGEDALAHLVRAWWPQAACAAATGSAIATVLARRRRRSRPDVSALEVFMEDSGADGR